MSLQEPAYRFLRPGPRRGDLARRSLIVVVAAAAAVFALVAQLGDNGIVSWWRLRAQTAAIERQVQELEASNAAVSRRLEELANDPAALEALARERHGMRRPDEEVLTVLQPPAESDGKESRLP